MNAVVVVPTNRPEQIAAWLEAWYPEIANAQVIVVCDAPTVYASVQQAKYSNAEAYCWADIDCDLGERAWIIPRHTDAIRSYGVLKALQSDPDMIVTLDDDCRPDTPGFLDAHWMMLNTPDQTPARTRTSTIRTRGLPYHTTARQRRVLLNCGAWTGVPDVDALTQLGGYNDEWKPPAGTVKVGQYFPLSGMNLAFTPTLTPALYFGLQGPDYPFDRFGDIWAGILAKRILDHLGLAVTSGTPLVHHTRTSNVWENLRKEAPGLEANETFWQTVDRTILTSDTITTSYRQLAASIRTHGTAAYWGRLADAMLIWTDLVVTAQEIGAEAPRHTP